MLQGFCLPALQPLLHLQHPYTPRRFGQPLRIRRSMQSEGMTALPSQWLPPMLIDFHPLIFTDHFSNVPYSKHYEPHLVIRFTRQLLDHAPEDSRSHLSTKSEKSLSRSFQTKSIILGYSDDFYWFLMYSIKAWHCRFWRKKSMRTALLQLAILARSSAVSSSRSCVALDSRRVETQDELRTDFASFSRAWLHQVFQL